MSSSSEFQSPQRVKVQRALTRRSFLLTYKHEKIFNKGELFQCCGSSKVEVCYWVCSREPHPNTSGFYYHMSIKMSGPKKKNFVKSELQEKPWDCCQLFYLSWPILLRFPICHERRPGVCKECKPPTLRRYEFSSNKKVY